MDANVAAQKITSKEKILIELFISEAGVIRHITPQRKFAIAISLVSLRNYIGDYLTCTTPEVYISIERYRASSGHSESYQKITLSTYKRFLIWLHESEYNTALNPTKIKNLSLKRKATFKTADDILTPQELKVLYEATRTLRDRALFEVLYESMGRVGEVAMLTWGQVTFHDTYTTITLESKTDYPRKVPLYTSQLILKRWREYYPVDITPDMYVFQKGGSEGKSPLTYHGVRRMLINACKSAGITRKVTLHIFRHTRITDLMRMGIPEQTIKMLAWGTVTTEMLRVYAHLTPTDAENDLNKWMGIIPKETKPAFADIATPVQCTGCGVINPKSNRFCGECGIALTKEGKEKHEQLLRLLQDDTIHEELTQLLLSKMGSE